MIGDITYWANFLKLDSVIGTPLGKAMDTDPRHNDEAIQVDACIPTDQN